MVRNDAHGEITPSNLSIYNDVPLTTTTATNTNYRHTSHSKTAETAQNDNPFNDHKFY